MRAVPKRSTNYVKSRRFKLLVKLTKWLLRPLIVGQLPDTGKDYIYVFYRRSSLDLALLCGLVERYDIHDPLSPLDLFEEEERYFYLLRPEGALRMYTMRRHSGRIARVQQVLMDMPDHELQVVPVSMFWGRTADKEKSISRSLFSEQTATTLELRRWLSLIFNRTDILVQFGTPIDWHEETDAKRSHDHNIRRIARLLRSSFKQTELIALGPTLITDKQVVERVANQLNEQTDAESEEVLSDPELRRAKRETKRMASHISYPMMRLFRTVLTWFWHRIYEGIELLESDRLASIARTHTLIYAPNHRSQTDFLVLSYMLFHAGYAIPRIAAGENMNFPVVGPLLRRCGAFFIRRTFRDDKVYHDVLANYLHMIVERGNPVEFFVEGGRSRTGLMLEPKFGLLQMVLESQRRGLPRPLALIPVYIAYESIPERNTYFAELSGAPKKAESVRDVFKNLSLLRKNLGKVQVKIGVPIELDRFSREDEEPSEVVARLGAELTRKINYTAILNSPGLIGLAMLAAPAQILDENSLVDYLDTLIALVRLNKPHHDFTLPAVSAVELIERAELLEHVERVQEGEVDLISCSEESAKVLTWFRNNVLHAVAIPSLLSCLLINREATLSEDECYTMVRTIEPLIRDELTTSPSIGAVRRALRHLAELNLLEHTDDGYGAIAKTDPQRYKLKLLANCLMPTLERFFLTGALINAEETRKFDLKMLAERAHTTYQSLNRLHGHEFPEFIPQARFERIAQTLVDTALLVQGDQGDLRATDPAKLIMAQAQDVIGQDFQQSLVRVLGQN